MPAEWPDASHDDVNYGDMSLEALLKLAIQTNSLSEMEHIHDVVLQRYMRGRDEELLQKVEERREKLALHVLTGLVQARETGTQLTPEEIDLEAAFNSADDPRVAAEEMERERLFKEGE